MPFEKCCVEFPDGAVDKLCLERGVRLLLLGQNHKSRGRLVEAVYYYRPRRIGIALARPCRYGAYARLAVDGEHAARFVYDNQSGILPYHTRFGRAYLEQRVGLHVESLEHEREYGLAFTRAGGVELAVAPHFARR